MAYCRLFDYPSGYGGYRDGGVVRPPAGTFAAAVPAAPSPSRPPLPAPATDPAPDPPSRRAARRCSPRASRRRSEASWPTPSGSSAGRWRRTAATRRRGTASGVVLIRQGDREPGLEALRTALRLQPVAPRGAPESRRGARSARPARRGHPSTTGPSSRSPPRGIPAATRCAGGSLELGAGARRDAGDRALGLGAAGPDARPGRHPHRRAGRHRPRAPAEDARSASGRSSSRCTSSTRRCCSSTSARSSARSRSPARSSPPSTWTWSSSSPRRSRASTA